PASPRRPLPPAKRTVQLPSFETLATTLPGIRVRERRCGTSVNYGNRPVTEALHRGRGGPVLAWNRDRGRGAGAGGAAFDRQLAPRLDRVRSAADHQLDLAGLDLPAAPDAPQGDMLGAQGEADEPGLSWCERHAAEAAQLLDRARHRGERIANVELDHLLAGAAAGIGHRHGHGHLAAIGRDRGAIQCQRAISEARVAEAVAEGVERGDRQVAIADRIGLQVLAGGAAA